MANVKYKGTNFLDWYKANYNGQEYDPNNKNGISQIEGMSDADYDIGQTLYNAYLRNNEADAAHQTAMSALADDKASAERSADVSYMRLQKYLPQQLAKQGLHSQGVTEDSYLKLQNNYMNNLIDINKNYSTQKTALEQAYMSDVNTREIALGEAVEIFSDL